MEGQQNSAPETSEGPSLADLISRGGLEDTPAPSPEPHSAEPSAESSPDEEPVTGESDENDQEAPEAPAIEPPQSWNAEQRKFFKEHLSPEAQKFVAERDAEQNRVFNQRVNQTTEAERAYQARLQQVDAEYANRAHALQTVTVALHNKLMGDYANIDMAELARRDPSLYAQAQEDIKARSNLIAAAQNQLRELSGKQQQQLSEARAKLVREGASKLQESVPELKDPAKAQEWQTKLRSYVVQEQGFSPSDYEGIVDHRVLLIADKARRWDELQKARPAVQTKVAAIPPVVPPSATQRGSRPADKANLTKVARYGNTSDQKNALSALIGRGALN